MYGINIFGHIGYTSYYCHSQMHSLIKTTKTINYPLIWLFSGSSVIVGGLMGVSLGVVSPLTYSYAHITNRPYILDNFSIEKY